MFKLANSNSALTNSFPNRPKINENNGRDNSVIFLYFYMQI